jgi:hypothetical protein
MTPQVASRQLQGGTSNTTGACDLTSYNATFTFTKDDLGNNFRIAVPTNCNLTVQQISNGVTTLLTTAGFTVRAWAGVSPTCVTTKADANTRQFSAQANVNYSFALYLANAPAAPATYKLNVVFL